MAAPINLRSLESRFPVRGCGQTVDLSANKRTKKSTEKEEKKRKGKRRGKRRKKKNAEREEPASQFTLLVRFISNLRNSKQLLLAETERNSKKKNGQNVMRTKYDIKGWPEGFIEFQRRITDFTGLLFNSKF